VRRHAAAGVVVRQSRITAPPAVRLVSSGPMEGATERRVNRGRNETGFAGATADKGLGGADAEDGRAGYRRNIYITYHDLEAALKNRGYSLYRLALGTLVAIAATTALFWNRIKHWGAQESASVATKTLEDEMLQRKAEDLAKQLTNALLTDERTRRAVQTLLKQVLSDPGARKDATAFVSQLLVVLMQRDDTKHLFSQFLADVLQYEIVKERAKDLGVWVAGHPFIVDKVKASLMDILEDADMRDTGKDYAMDATLRTLRDRATREWLQRIVEDVFNDPQFQEKAGEALWNATKTGVLGLGSSRRQVQKEIQEIEKIDKAMEEAARRDGSK